MKTPLTDGLKKLAQDDRIRLHMPGHKGRVTVDGTLDFTEIPGDDNLHDAHGIIAASEAAIAEVYGADESRLLVGSTTAGIIAAIMAGASEGETVLIPDSAHKSVFSALFLGRITPVFIETPLNPDWHYYEGITTRQVAQALDAHPDVQGMVLPNPSYYGTVSDVRAIADLLHARGKWLIVDEAHGAHLIFSNRMPVDAVTTGADIVIQSTHKMLGGLTQSAVLHYNSLRVDREKCDLYLRTLQSSSPSYLLMMGIEQAVADADARGKAVFDAIAARHDAAAAEQIEQSEKIKEQNMVLIAGGDDTHYDKTKWVFGVKDGTGLEIGRELREKYGIYLEIESPELLLAYTGIGTTAQDIDALLKAMYELNTPISRHQKREIINTIFPGKFNQAVPLWRAMATDKTQKTWCALSDCEGKIAADMVIPYPPGVPVLLPGDKLTAAHVAVLTQMVSQKVNCLGIEDGRIAVLK